MPAYGDSSQRSPATSSIASAVGSRAGVVGDQRPDRLVPLLLGRDRDDLPLRVAQRGELAAEDHAGVEADRVVDPLGLRDRRVAVDDHRLAAVVAGPRVADREAVLVGLAGGVAVQRERPDPARAAAVVGLLEPGVRDHQPAVVEDEVADQPVHERQRLGAELLALLAQLRERLGQAVADPDVGALERADQLGLVVAGDAQRGAGGDHAHHQPEHARRVRAAVDEVADEQRGAALGVGRADGAAGVVVRQLPAELGEQGAQLAGAAVHVADDVERAGEVAAVVPGPLGRDRGGLDLVDAGEHVHPPEPLLADAAQRLLEVAVLTGDHVGAELPVRPGGVALGGDLLGYVEHDRVDQHVVLAGQLDQRLAGRLLDAGGVDDGEQPAAQPGADEVLQHVEGVLGRGLVVGVVGHQAAAVVAGDDLPGREVLRGEGALAAAGDADQHDQPHRGDRQLSHGPSIDAGPPAGSAGRTRGRGRRCRRR